MSYQDDRSRTIHDPAFSNAAGDQRPTVAVTPDDARLSAAGFVGSTSTEQETVILRRKPQPLAWLIRRDGPRAGQMFRLSAEGTTIGRDAQSDIVLDDEAVSRWHAKVKCEESPEDQKQMIFVLYDMASENGSFVNGDRIYRQPLKESDLVELGQTALVFKRL